MKFGAQFVNYFTNWEATLPAIKTVEAGRWNSLWFSDHFLPPVGPAQEAGDALESWSMITAAAAVTSRLRLGILVTGNTYRNPGLTAKMAGTVDQISLRPSASVPTSSILLIAFNSLSFNKT